MEHRVFGVEQYSNKTVAVTFSVKGASAGQIAIEGYQNFGTGGSTSISSISAQKITVSTSWTKHTVFIAFPSVSSKTIGTEPYTMIRFWVDAGSDYNTNTDSLGNQSANTITFAAVRIYKASVELPVRRRSLEEERQLCLPYFQKIKFYVVGNGLVATATVARIRMAIEANFIRDPGAEVTYNGVTQARIYHNGGYDDVLAAPGFNMSKDGYTNVTTTAASISSFASLYINGGHLFINAEI